jgi:hypothetical protein
MKDFLKPLPCIVETKFYVIGDASRVNLGLNPDTEMGITKNKNT